MFSDRKAAQIAAYFLTRAASHRMAHLKLIKLMYLADRQSLREYGFPISGDHMVAMPRGPVLSQTLNLINGGCRPSPDGWDQWISDRENHEVTLVRSDVCRADLDELSDADLKVLKKVWADFGRMEKFDLCDWTHDNCAEWVDPEGSSLPIKFADVLRAVGWRTEDAQAAADSIDAQATLSRTLARL